ncbi:MAG: hypothetical protein P8X84_02320, partial [Candidatus Bathyarchaeota archaeon]
MKDTSQLNRLRNNGNGNGKDTKISKDSVQQKTIYQAGERQPSNGKSSSKNHASMINLNQAINHSYDHQARTMEIHQQYLSQQQDYIQLVTAVLNQQGKVLDNGNQEAAPEIINTFQKTMDRFHSIREQGLKVHQEFLTQQANFSQRYLQ